jgi:hypothetical protein
MLGLGQRNEELDHDQRWAAGGGLVHVQAQSNRNFLRASVGAAYTRERYSGEPVRNVAEAVTGLSWDWFTFDGKSTTLSFDALTFVAIQSNSRFRAELNTSFKSLTPARQPVGRVRLGARRGGRQADPWNRL